MNRWLCDLADEAGRWALEFLRTGFVVTTKPDRTVVTSADLYIDKFVREAILAQFPGDCVLSEEAPDDPVRLTASRVWIVDPIDGTSHFASERPDFGTLIALCVDGKAVESAARFPKLELTIYANKDAGAFVNGRKVSVSTTQELYGAKIACHAEGLQDMHTVRGMERNNALSVFKVAAGEIDGCVVRTGETTGEHDYAWASCLVEAAGGTLTDIDGIDLRYNKEVRRMPSILVCSNGSIHKALAAKVKAELEC
jgi:myo-inositol-1(or 4)-monophosphatase